MAAFHLGLLSHGASTRPLPPSAADPRVPMPFAISSAQLPGAKYLTSSQTFRPLQWPLPLPTVRQRTTRAQVEAAGPTTQTQTQREGGSLADAPAVPFLDPETGSPSPFPSSSGVYAIYDSARELQYMGLSRRLNASLALHLSELPDLCASAKVLEVAAPERAVLVEAWKAWMEEHVATTGAPPPGNAPGNTTWTSRKPRAGKPDIRLTPGGNKQLTIPLTELIAKVVKEFRVVAFIKGTRTAPECGFSHRVLTILNESRVDYEVLNVLDEEHNPGLRDAIKQYSQWPTIPQVFVEGEFIGGADIIGEMAESGELKALLSKAKA